MLPSNPQTSIDLIKISNMLFIVAAIMMCALLMLLQIPGVELLGVSPNWLLIGLVAWSIRSTIWQGAIAGITLGCIYDGMAIDPPSHILGFVIVGVFTSSLQTQKYIGEDFISIAFIVFFMSICAETIYAVQYARVNFLEWSQVWQKYQQTVLISAMVSSLWSPAFYYPFKIWNSKIARMVKTVSS